MIYDASAPGRVELPGPPSELEPRAQLEVNVPAVGDIDIGLEVQLQYPEIDLKAGDENSHERFRAPVILGAGVENADKPEQ